MNTPLKEPSAAAQRVATFSPRHTVRHDPRHQNETFDCTSVASYLAGYTSKLKAVLDAVDAAEMERARHTIETAAHERRRIFVVGNGGSAAIADHLCCDWTKGTNVEGKPVVDTHSLSSNGAIFSAIANDYGFERVFSTQLDLLGHQGDVLVAISASGNSPNILNALETAHELGMTSIGLTGFDGGRLRQSANVALHAQARNYGVVEDAHQALMHVLSQFIALARESPAMERPVEQREHLEPA